MHVNTDVVIKYLETPVGYNFFSSVVDSCALWWEGLYEYICERSEMKGGKVNVKQVHLLGFADFLSL